jgi:hypothetical protein
MVIVKKLTSLRQVWVILNDRRFRRRRSFGSRFRPTPSCHRRRTGASVPSRHDNRNRCSNFDQIVRSWSMSDERRVMRWHHKQFRRSRRGAFIKVPHSALIGLLLACGLSACSRDVTAVGETEYAAKVVGEWRGIVGDTNETVSFAADGKFVSQVRPRGFISNTLGEGITGTIRGTWATNG